MGSVEGLVGGLGLARNRGVTAYRDDALTPRFVTALSPRLARFPNAPRPQSRRLASSSCRPAGSLPLLWSLLDPPRFTRPRARQLRPLVNLKAQLPQKHEA